MRIEVPIQPVTGEGGDLPTPVDNNFLVGNSTPAWEVQTPSAARSSLGLDTMAQQAANSVDIGGGEIDGATIGANSAAAITGTTLTATGNTDLQGTLDVAGAFTFNDAGADVDARFEGSTDANLIYLDAGNNRIGIGVATPDARLHIHEASAGTVSASSLAQVVIEDDASAGLNLLTPNTGNCRILFGDADDNDVGIIRYDHSANSFFFDYNATRQVNWTPSIFNWNVQGADIDFRVQASGVTHALLVQGSDGAVGINNSAPSSTLDVIGTFAFSGNGTMGGNLDITAGTLDVGGVATFDSGAVIAAAQNLQLRSNVNINSPTTATIDFELVSGGTQGLKLTSSALRPLGTLDLGISGSPWTGLETVGVANIALGNSVSSTLSKGGDSQPGGNAVIASGGGGTGGAGGTVDIAEGTGTSNGGTVNLAAGAGASGTVNICNSGTGGTINMGAATITMADLPTSDPLSAGQLWNDSGTLKVSAG